MIKARTFKYSSLKSNSSNGVQLVFVFFKRETWNAGFHPEIQTQFPNADIIYCSSSGHAFENMVVDEEIIFSTISFEKTEVKCTAIRINDFENAFEAGKYLGAELFDEKTRYIGVISDGAMVNGTKLCDGINQLVHGNIPVTGGLAGDMTNFEKTLVGLNSEPSPGIIVGLKLSGEDLEVASSSKGGFIPFGMEMKITASKENVLQQIDHKNAYDVLYKVLAPNDQQDFENNLLYFPLMVDSINSKNLIRTPLVVNHENKEITYAGDMPEGAKIQVTRTNSMDMLEATTIAMKELNERLPDFQLLFTVSCVGRRIILDSMKDEELTEIEEYLPENAVNFGFYSYGEINTDGEKGSPCKLHNQTLTLTAFKER